MQDTEYIHFLQEYLPGLGYRWKGFRKVRKQVCKRIRYRFRELGLADLTSYRQFLEKNKDEEQVLDGLCNITISRFYRDREVFARIADGILPSLAERALENRDRSVRCWSAGCCSGEEPYTLQILWKLLVLPRVKTDIHLKIISTDRDANLLERAKNGIYPGGSFKDMPQDLKDQAFEERDGNHYIKDTFKQDVQFLEQDIRKELPDGEFDLILCRNLVFTYFQEDLQDETLRRMIVKLKPGGFLVVGIHESIPEEQDILVPAGKCIYRKRSYSFLRLPYAD